MSAIINAAIHNDFDIIVRDSITGEIKNQGHAENIILNAFWPVYLSGSGPLGRIHFGSGTAEPSVTDISLTTFIALKNVTDMGIDMSTFKVDGIVKNRKTIRIQAGEQTGKSISEVGFGGSESNTLRTKALLRDSNGNPVSIVIGELDVIDIYATFYVRIPMNLIDRSGDIAIISRGTSILISMLAGQHGFLYPYFSGYLNFGLVEPYVLESRVDTSGYSMSTGASGVSYDVPNRKVIATFPNIIASNANNVPGYSSFDLGGACIKLPRTGFTQPIIVKEVIGTGDGVKKDFSCKFGKILNNGTAKLFVDDVEVPATFDYLVPPYNQSSSGFIHILSDSNTETIYENIYNHKYGVDAGRIYNSGCELYVSDDGITWVLAHTVGYFTVSAANRYKRYFKFTKVAITDTLSYLYTYGSVSAPVIHATNVPPSGSTISLTYQPDCVAKDNQHIINNMKLEMAFNEYIPT